MKCESILPKVNLLFPFAKQWMHNAYSMFHVPYMDFVSRWLCTHFPQFKLFNVKDFIWNNNENIFICSIIHKQVDTFHFVLSVELTVRLFLLTFLTVHVCICFCIEIEIFVVFYFKLYYSVGVYCVQCAVCSVHYINTLSIEHCITFKTD